MPLILIGRYLPIRRLGRGGFGAAYLAVDRYTPTMRRCVVKQFQPSGDLSPQQLQIAQQLFEREALVLEELGNADPQIPDLFAFFPLEVSAGPGKVPERFFYLVQEYIDGENLEEELTQKGKFSETEVLEVLREMLKILKFVHANNSIHRDIKPANIMRDRKGKLYLLDFGAVKQVTQGAAGEAQQRSTGIYSMGFAPPEQMAGSTVFPSTDLYALAVTCITLLTGKPTMELFDSYSNQWHWRPYAQVSDRLAAVLDRLLLPAPNQRFASAAEVLAVLNPKQPKPTPTSAPTQVVAPAAPPPPPPVTQPPLPPAPPAMVTPAKASFSTLQLLTAAAFTGFESALFAISIVTLQGISGISYLIWLALVAGLIFVQSRHFVEGKDLPIIAGITLAIVLFTPLHGKLGLDQAIIYAVLAGLSAIAVTALFRLIYKLLSSFL